MLLYVFQKMKMKLFFFLVASNVILLYNNSFQLNYWYTFQKYKILIIKLNLQPFAIDSSVFYESWVGGVYDVKCNVTFASQDGSIFTLEDPYRRDFISLSTSDVSQLFY